MYAVRKSIEEVEYQGCVFSQGQPFEVGFTDECIGSTSGCGGTGPVALAGTLLAREVGISSPVLGTSWLVEVEDLRTRRIVRKVPTGSPLEPEPHYSGVGEVVSLVVKNDGGIAWIAWDSERSSNIGSSNEVRYYDVYSSDHTGTHLLAAGTNVAPRSLALVGSTIYWTQAGAPHSAPLR